MPDPIEVLQAKNTYQEMILRKRNVVGVGVGLKESGGKYTDEVAVVALVRRKVPLAGLPADALVPRQVGGVDTDVIEVGHLRALQQPTDRWRPAPGGVSLGHYKITAGTFGTVVRDRTSGDRLILSNNHVMANSNDAAAGDAILQPGPADGGREETDTIARLERFVPIEFFRDAAVCGIANSAAGTLNALASMIGSRHRLEAYQTDPNATNLVDAAVARPISDADILDEIKDIGVVSGTTEAQLGMTVRKSGRTTGFTVGTITVVDATVEVDYAGPVARFERQIVGTAMSQGGDSGSLLVHGDSLLAVGLLFAGSEQATIFNPIDTVLELLEVVL